MKLTIGNSMCKFEGLPEKHFKALRKLVSYEADAQASYFSGNYNNTRYLLDKRGFFPTGLLYIAKRYLHETLLKVHVLDTRVYPKPSVLGTYKCSLGVTPYPEQENAATAILERHRGIICAPTGVGKSLIIALIIAKLKVPTLIVVPTLELKRQLTESLKAAFAKLSVGPLPCTVAVENVDALDTRKPLKGYDCVIIDEFHHSAAKTYRKLNEKCWNDVYYRVGLTATPFRSKDNERLLLESILSQVVYRVDYHKAVEKGYIVPMEAYYIDLPKQEVKGDTWAQVYSELVVNNKYRNNVIKEILDNAFEAKLSLLCLVKEIEHGKILAGCIFDFANGEDGTAAAAIAKFNKGEKGLVGTTGVLGEGVDTRPAEYIIIAGLGKSKNAFMQMVGRGFRRHGSKETCKIIIFRDKSHRWTLAHFREQCKILREEYGVVPVKLEVA